MLGDRSGCVSDDLFDNQESPEEGIDSEESSTTSVWPKYFAEGLAAFLKILDNTASEKLAINILSSLSNNGI